MTAVGIVFARIFRTTQPKYDEFLLNVCKVDLCGSTSSYNSANLKHPETNSDMLHMNYLLKANTRRNLGKNFRFLRRARTLLNNENSLAKFRFDTSANEPSTATYLLISNFDELVKRKVCANIGLW